MPAGKDRIIGRAGSAVTRTFESSDLLGNRLFQRTLKFVFWDHACTLTHTNRYILLRARLVVRLDSTSPRT